MLASIRRHATAHLQSATGSLNMTIPEKGSRRIIVGEAAYRWRVRHKATYVQAMAWTPLSFAVELEAEGLCSLVVEVDTARPDNWLGSSTATITPVIVERAIRAALEQGWQPREPGSAHALSLCLA